jgi:predicted O-methyltransferase YrrM
MSTLEDLRVRETLDRLHHAARGDWKHVLTIVPSFVWSKVTGRGFMQSVAPARFKHMYIPVSRDMGRMLYLLARSTGARTIVEFGCSFGISTIYLAAAVRDNGGGRVITTEIEPTKCRVAEDNLRAAGLDDIATILEGDALRTLPSIGGPIDLLFLDGWKNLYIPVLDIVEPKLRPGALLLADNINFAEVKPYLERVRSGSGNVSTTLDGGKMECTLTAA